MNFETWWNLSGASVIHKEPKDAARDAWHSGLQEGVDRMFTLYAIQAEQAEQEEE